eukprot:15442560-Alexandrium_andersonii.AAC.1
MPPEVQPPTVGLAPPPRRLRAAGAQMTPWRSSSSSGASAGASRTAKTAIAVPPGLALRPRP